MKILNKPHRRFNKALTDFKATQAKGDFATTTTTKKLANHYEWAANWLDEFADKEIIEDHVDIFFKDQVLGDLAKELRLTSHALKASLKAKTLIPTSRISQLYYRLNWIFKCEIDFFERKKFASLSHEPNKAMNLNSYIGLMGGSYKQEQTPDGIILMPAPKGKKGIITIPDSEYLLTLDADSILLRDYCLRLVYFLEQPDNKKVAVTQTPYSSFRGAGTRIERLAGATTDIQHILHQGMTYYNATFWVGANAVIRKAALEDIVETEFIGGFEMKRFIQDSTVIEDTESSVDLAFHGWRLVNYPERLSYSATPPDFGSLVVQRRRWANGGLLILPKLFNQAHKRKRLNEPVSAMEMLIRLNYMASIAWASFGLIFLLAYPYDGRLLSPLVLLAALPYFLAMSSDLKYCGYRRSDVLLIYGFNLILLPVNLAGVLKSLEQALTGKKIPFARTPKVKNRTLSPILYVIAPPLIVAFSIFILWENIMAQNWGNAAFAGFNTFAATLAIIAYIGLGNTLSDIWYGLTDWLYVEVSPKSNNNLTTQQNAFNWQAVLYYGDEKETVPLAVRNLDNIKKKKVGSNEK